MANCSCLGTPTVSTPPPCATGTNCLKMSDIIVACKDGVGPCGAIGTLNVITSADPLKPYCHNTTGCGDTPIKLSIIGWDVNIFELVTITNSTISWTTKGVSTVGKFGIIKLKACCGEFESLFCVIVCIKDLCKCAGCTASEECDPCTGDCEDRLIDVSVGDYSANIDISLV